MSTARAEARLRVRGVKLGTKLVMLLIAMVALVCVVIAAITHVSVSNQINHQVNQELQRAVDRMDRYDASLMSGGHGTGETPPAGESPPSDAGGGHAPGFLHAPGQGEFVLGAIVEGGAVTEGGYIDGGGVTTQLSSADQEALAALTPSRRTRDVSLSIGEYRVAVLSAADGTNVITGVSISDARATLTRLNYTLVGVSAAALIITGTVGLLLVRRAMRPLGEVATVADDVAGTALDTGEVEPIARVPRSVAGQGDEVGAVARALNTMLDNVDHALQHRHASEMQVRRFVADASHELRTPLTSIRGYAELLGLTGGLTENDALAVGRILSQTDRMRVLVDDMLLLARLDQSTALAGGTDEVFDLGELLAEAMMDAQVVAPDHEFTLDIPEHPLPVRAEVHLVERLVSNVVSNARKHTPPGTHVSLSARERDGAAIVEIADTGEGMSEELARTIFDRFARGDASRTGREGSSGLGMSIAKAVTERLGGHISVSSAPGAGTAVRIELPLAADQGRVERAAPQPRS